MAARQHDYDLIAVLHDQLEDISGYDRLLEKTSDCPECVRIWTILRDRAQEAVTMIRAEVQRHASE